MFTTNENSHAIERVIRETRIRQYHVKRARYDKDKTDGIALTGSCLFLCVRVYVKPACNFVRSLSRMCRMFLPSFRPRPNVPYVFSLSGCCASFQLGKDQSTCFVDTCECNAMYPSPPCFVWSHISASKFGWKQFRVCEMLINLLIEEMKN